MQADRMPVFDWRKRAIAYDIARLFLAPAASAPRGIDRIDLLLAEHIFVGWEGDVFGILPTPWGVRVFERDRVVAGLEYLQNLWRETTYSAHDPALRQLSARMCGGASSSLPGVARNGLALKGRRILAQLKSTGFTLGKGVRTALPQSSAYLNIGQIGLAVPPLFRWLDSRPDVSAIFMVHDVIPLEYPSLVEPGAPGHHRRMVKTTARHADGLILTTEHARRTVCAELQDMGSDNLPAIVRGLPVARAFDRPGTFSGLSRAKYFVVCASIEPRKNHELLLRIWKRLLAQGVDDPPHLVLAGSPAWCADNILAPLHDDGLRNHVHHVCGLSTPALAALLSDAHGLLMPSFAEGFGLPVLEANVLGVPAIASDIPAHREIADATTLLIPPNDENAWFLAIHELSRVKSRRSRRQNGSLIDPACYYRDVMEFVATCPPRTRKSAAV